MITITKVLDGWASLGMSYIDATTLLCNNTTPPATMEFNYQLGLVRWLDQNNLGDPGPYTFEFEQTLPDDIQQNRLASEAKIIYEEFVATVIEPNRGLIEYWKYQNAQASPIHDGIVEMASALTDARDAPSTTWGGFYSVNGSPFDVTSASGLQAYQVAFGQDWENKMYTLESDYASVKVYIETAPLTTASTAVGQFRTKYG